MNVKSTGFIVACVCFIVGIAGCSLGQLATTAQDTQAITQPKTPTGTAATQPAVIEARPIVQAAGGLLPNGTDILSLIAGVSGLALGFIKNLQASNTSVALAKQTQVTAGHASAIREMTSKLSVPVTQLSEATQKSVHLAAATIPA